MGSNSESAGSSRDMRESQRALELRKFFAPHHWSSAPAENGFHDSLNSDGALGAYAETIIWRLHGVHAMVSLVDRGEQYFLAGAIRAPPSDEEDVDDVISSRYWFNCSSASTPGGLCENTLALDDKNNKYPCFIVNDLAKDKRFANLPVVDGSIAKYRFYAGTPITTSHGINIGSLFFFDDKVRDDLSLGQRKFLHQQAANVMRHLETKREAAERHRVALMSKGIADFLERTSQQNYLEGESSTISEDATQPPIEADVDGPPGTGACHSEPAQEPILDKIQTTLDHAADILRESLELIVGGVAFLDTAVGYTDTDNIDAYLDKTTDLGSLFHRKAHGEKGRQRLSESSLRPMLYIGDGGTNRHLSQGSIRDSTDKHKASKILAMSAAKIATWGQSRAVLDAETLQTFINSYPKGNVWYIDDEGYFSSLDQTNESERASSTSPSERRPSISPIGVAAKQAEASLLSQIFHKARQIIFLPLWDTGGERWYSGCFVWSQSAVPVFTVESEIAYLSAFTNSVMVEISRLDAITANKMKSDFISSISHEFRSPLHGILASAEFLRDSELDATQVEFISTIQNCSGTLLDTINHVLDYSKINSFEKAGNQQGTISNELYQVTNLALLCEDTVNGMIAANEFRGAGSDGAFFPITKEMLSRSPRQAHHRDSPLEVIVDIEPRDWEFKVQPGALRPVVMNIFGNAQKYTQSGYIMVQLRIQERPQNNAAKSHGEILSLHIRDSGRGMSPEYMERKLYHPFAQEDNFAPGVGLGLSIVWSIVNKLGGKIEIRSEIGKGTDVEVTLPVEKEEAPKASSTRPGDLVKVSVDSEDCIDLLRRKAFGKSVSFSRSESLTPTARHKAVAWDCIAKYCSEWFGLEIKEAFGDVVISDQEDLTEHSQDQRTLIVHEDIAWSKQEQKSKHPLVGYICNPIGPFKLARSIMALIDREMPNDSINFRNRSDVSTQTLLGSLEERTMLNGMIMMDYGFSAPQSSSYTPGSSQASQGTEPHDSASQAQQQDDRGQAIAAIRSFSGMTLQLPERPKINPPETVDNSPEPASINPPSIPLPPSPTRTTSSPQTNTPSTNSLHILAVDDNAVNLQLLNRYLLKRKSDTIVTAINGVEALAAVRNPKKANFDVIFMDISMPEMDGFEATRLIRSFERSLAHRSVSEDNEYEDGNVVDGMVEKEMSRAYIVALTGLASRRDRDEAVECGFDDYLTKPISFGKIGELLKRLSAEKGIREGVDD